MATRVLNRAIVHTIGVGPAGHWLTRPPSRLPRCPLLPFWSQSLPFWPRMFGAREHRRPTRGGLPPGEAVTNFMSSAGRSELQGKHVPIERDKLGRLGYGRAVQPTKQASMPVVVK